MALLNHFSPGHIHTTYFHKIILLLSSRLYSVSYVPHSLRFYNPSLCEFCVALLYSMFQFYLTILDLIIPITLCSEAYRQVTCLQRTVYFELPC